MSKTGLQVIIICDVTLLLEHSPEIFSRPQENQLA